MRWSDLLEQTCFPAKILSTRKTTLLTTESAFWDNFKSLITIINVNISYLLLFNINIYHIRMHMNTLKARENWFVTDLKPGDKVRKDDTSLF